jgi:hypothetical protein
VAALAVGIAGLVLVAVAVTIAGDRALQCGIDGVDTSERAFEVTMSRDLSPTPAELATINGEVDSRLQRRGLGTMLHTVEFRALAAGDGRTVRLAGLDDLQQATRLVDGAWPTRCDSQRCEVVALRASSAETQPIAPIPADSALGLTIVGTAVATNDLVLSGQLRPDEAELILLGEGVANVSGLSDYQLFRRTYAWQVPVVSRELRSIDVGPLLAAVRSVSSNPALSGFGLTVSGPEDELLSISGRTRISGNRLAVPVGALLVLFFGVALLAGVGGRADHRRTASLLRRRGADRIVMVSFRMLEAAMPVVGGLIMGFALALGVGAWLGRRAGLGGRSVLARSFDGSLGTHLAAVGAAVWLLIFVVLSINEVPRVHSNRRPRASDVAGLAALVVLVVLIGRGSVSTGSLNREIDPVLVAVPILAAVALAAVVVRLVPIVLQAASNASPRRWPLTKLTLAESTAQPLRSVATASLIAVTVMFALLTFGYASTLRLGSRDQAAFAVPYDFRLQLGSALVRPQAVAPSGGWSAEAPGTTATDVLRRGVAVRRSATHTQTVELLGLEPTTLNHLHGWRQSFGADPVALGKSIDQSGPEQLGTSLPDNAVTIEFRGSGFEGLHTSAVIARANGTWHELTLDEEIDGGVRTSLTPGDAGGELVGFRLSQPGDVSKLIEHHIGEGDTSVAAQSIDVVLSQVQAADADGRSTTIDLDVDRLRAADATVEVQANRELRVTGSILGVSILVTPPGPDHDAPLNAVMDPATARTATNGIVTIETSNGNVRLRPSSIVDRFPGVGARFAIVDVAVLQPALDLLQPGAGTANEVWLAVDTAANEGVLATRLSDGGYDSIEVDRRHTRQVNLASDPLAVVTLLILTASAAVAIVLGACAVVAGAAADANDDRPLLRMLALERVGGRRLVGMVAGKSMAAVTLAIPLGLVGGRWLLQIATRLVGVSATSGEPDPPLRLAVPWITVGSLSVALLAVLGVGSIVGAMSARRVPNEDLMRGTT